MIFREDHFRHTNGHYQHCTLCMTLPGETVTLISLLCLSVITSLFIKFQCKRSLLNFFYKQEKVVIFSSHFFFAISVDLIRSFVGTGLCLKFFHSTLYFIRSFPLGSRWEIENLHFSPRPNVSMFILHTRQFPIPFSE